MAPTPEVVALPASYSDLGFTEIKIENHPRDSKTVTPIQILTLYRPGRRNAFTYHMTDELEEAFRTFDIDDRVRCIIVTGDGNVFCAGADLDNMLKKTDKTTNEHRDEGGRVTVAIHNCRKPVIGALNGAAVGVGITMTLPMAIRLAPADAKIGFVFGRRGLIMEAGSSYFLPRLIGLSKAMHLVTTGAIYPASHPLLSDLFTETLPSGAAVLARALEIAQEFVENSSTVSWALNRDLMWHNPGTPEATHLLDSKIIYDLFGSPDHTEGVQSFLNKRKANFKGTIQRDAPQSYPWWEPIDIFRRPRGKIDGSKL